jgi:hypothetical protein
MLQNPVVKPYDSNKLHNTKGIRGRKKLSGVYEILCEEILA